MAICRGNPLKTPYTGPRFSDSGLVFSVCSTTTMPQTQGSSSQYALLQPCQALTHSQLHLVCICAVPLGKYLE